MAKSTSNKNPQSNTQSSQGYKGEAYNFEQIARICNELTV